MKFNGSSGRKPSAEARRYIYAYIAATLRNQLDNGWIGVSDEALDQFDMRRLEKETLKVIVEMEKKSE